MKQNWEFRALKKIKWGILLIAFLSFLVLPFSIAYAQSKEQRKKGRKVIKIKEIVIKQRVIKPQAMFILTKSQQAQVKSDITTSQNFSSEIIDTVHEKFLVK